MNKIFKKTVATVLAFGSLFAATACGGGTGSSGGPGGGSSGGSGGGGGVVKQSLKVVVSNLGFGTDWAHAIADAFEQTHPGVTVDVEETVLSSALISQMEAGSNIGDVCMFNDDALWRKWREGLLTELDDVVQTVPDGETKTIYEKTNKTLIDAYQVSNGHWYSLPWINENTGMVYNATSLDMLIGKGKWELPKTTKELWDLCDDIKTAGGYGFVWNNAYLGHNIWQAQYNGMEKNLKYDMGYYLDSTDNQWKMSTGELETTYQGTKMKVIEAVYQNTGYERAVAQMEKMVQKYSHQYATNMTHIYAQSCWAGLPYAGDAKRCVFMPNGDWTYNETLDYLIATKSEIGFMRYPVITDMVETLELYKDGTTPYSQLSAAKQESYDNLLRSVIDYVDEGETGTLPAGVSQNDLDRIREARQIVGGKCQAEAFIPVKSAKKDLAKEFLVFMASDMAIDLFSENTYGFSPFISAEKLQTIDFGVRFMDEVKATLQAAPLKLIRKYTDIQTAGFYSPYEMSFHSDVKERGAVWSLQRGMAIEQENWKITLKNADRQANQLWVDGSLMN